MLKGFKPKVEVYNVMLPFGTKKAPKVTAEAADINEKVTVKQALINKIKGTGTAYIEVTTKDKKIRNIYEIRFRVLAKK